MSASQSVTVSRKLAAATRESSKPLNGKMKKNKYLQYDPLLQASTRSPFVTFYYQTFDTNRQGLAGLYRDHSMLTFETTSVQGTAAIVEKLGALPFQKVQHQIATFDAQPSSDNGIIVLVTGALLVDEEQKPMNYSQLFKLQPEGGSYFVLNDVFRLIYSA
ncbi:unnamed protein product [Penicillium salamii]|uniref:Nuclear transport factor 2 n=1 Tax=Penicillium salamii TaxID=1612424 RepID=A0A9W4NCY8_9EURO|nr:unnamed protein product [Penicillium salamii]